MISFSSGVEIRLILSGFCFRITKCLVRRLVDGRLNKQSGVCWVVSHKHCLFWCRCLSILVYCRAPISTRGYHALLKRRAFTILTVEISTNLALPQFLHAPNTPVNPSSSHVYLLFRLFSPQVHLTRSQDGFSFLPAHLSFNDV